MTPQPVPFSIVYEDDFAAVVDKPAAVIAVLVTLLAFFTDLSPVVFVLLAAVAGLLIKQAGGARK